MTGDALLLLFIKAPVRGAVKSRLAAVLGEDAALELYRNFVLDMLATIDRSGLPCRICYHPPDAGERVAGWLGKHRAYLAQTGDDVGERMEQAFRRAFAEGTSRAVLVGSDLPDLPQAVLADAVGSLAQNDAVIGPAQDGGYYLIGFRRDRLLPAVFQGMPWSSDSVFMRTMKTFDQAGCRVHVLPAWRDVDTAQDLKDLMTRRHDPGFSSSRTMMHLARNWNSLFPQEDRHATI
jgi:rSAM/selenodomain-associated transferase 1